MYSVIGSGIHVKTNLPNTASHLYSSVVLALHYPTCEPRRDIKSDIVSIQKLNVPPVAHQFALWAHLLALYICSDCIHTSSSSLQGLLRTEEAQTNKSGGGGLCPSNCLIPLLRLIIKDQAAENIQVQMEFPEYIFYYNPKKTKM